MILQAAAELKSKNMNSKNCRLIDMLTKSNENSEHGMNAAVGNSEMINLLYKEFQI